MKCISKRLLSLVLVLMLVASLLPVSALPVSAETTWTEVATWDELSAALTAGGNIRMTAPIEQTASIIVKSTVTLDFNGNTLTLLNTIYNPITFNGTTVLQDTSESAAGGMYINGTAGKNYQLLRVGGKLTVNSGVYKIDGFTAGLPRVFHSWGTTTVNGGNFNVSGSSTSAIYGAVNTSGGKMYINGGSFTVANTAGEAYGAFTDATGTNSILQINGGSFDVDAYTTVYGISLGSNAATVLDIPAGGNEITVDVCSATASAYGIRNQGTATLHSDKLTVTATTDVTEDADKYAYALRNEGTITVTAGNYLAYVTDQDTTKAQANGFCNSRVDANNVGTGTITGGYFYGSAPGGRGMGMVITYSNGFEIGGNVEADANGRSLYVYRGAATVSGGTFTSSHASYNVEVNSLGDLTITGGTFETAGTKYLRVNGPMSISGGIFKFNENSISVGTSGSLTITGGTFTGPEGRGMFDMYKYFDTAVYGQDNSGTVVAADAVAPRFEVTANNVTTQTESHFEMLDLISADTTGSAKIKLLRDIDLGASIDFTVSAEIDLNGYNWLQNGGINIRVADTAAGTTFVHDGALLNYGQAGNLYVSGGSMHMDNVVAYSPSSMPIAYYTAAGSDSINANNLIENSTLITNRYYVFSFRSGTAQTNVAMTFENTDLVNIYHKDNGGDIFFNGTADTTGSFILGEDVNLYTLYEGANVTYNCTSSTVTGTLHDKQAAASYGNINNILTMVGNALGYEDGQYVYKKESVWTTTPSLYKVSTQHTFADSACTCGETTVAVVGDTDYQDLATALNAATAGQTVTLNGNITTTANLLVDSAVALDLNNKELDAGSLTVYGTVIDGATGGKALVKSDNLHIAGDSYLPVYDSTNAGYRFYKYDLAELGNKTVSTTSVKFGFRLTLDNVSGYALLQDADNKISVSAAISWSGDSNNTLNYSFEASTLQNLAAVLLDGKTNYAITLTINGTDALGEGGTLSFAPSVGTGCGFTKNGQGNTWTASTT